MKSILWLLIAAVSSFASSSDGEPTVGEFMVHHVIDNREYWQIFPSIMGMPGIIIPINFQWMVGGINLFPSLHAIILIITAFVVFLVLSKSAKRKNLLPSSKMGHAIEAIVLYLRNEVVEPNIGKKEADKWLPFIGTLFFFILFMNYIGLIPGLAGPSANITVTATLALMVFVIFNSVGMIKNGPINYILNLVPKGLPLPITFLMFPIEVVGVFVKAIALAIRLFANMAAGHFVVMALLSITIVLQHSTIAIAAVPFTVAMLSLKLIVALLQAYVFTLLTTLYIGAAIHQDH